MFAAEAVMAPPALMSTTPPGLEGTWRRPFTSTRVRATVVAPWPFRPRRSRKLPPEDEPPRAAAAAVALGRKAGVSLITSVILVAPRCWTTSWPSTVVGVGAVKPERATREAVTTTSPTSAPSSWA